MEPFTYRPLDEGEIRVLSPIPTIVQAKRLAFELTTISIIEDPTVEYKTASYCWGEATHSREVIINERALLVPNGTYQALHCITVQDQENRQPLWIDAICINQVDKNEREAQVALMGRIYAGASRNLIYLGDEDNLTQAAIEDIRHVVSHIRRISGYYGGNRREEVLSMDRLFDGGQVVRQIGVIINVQTLLHFFQRPWFRRVWVLQEAVLPPHSVCLVGDHRVRLDDVIDAAAFSIKYLALSGQGFVSPGVTAASTMWEHLTLRLSREGRPTGRLANTLTRTTRFECSDDRDRIFGVLGLTHGILNIPELLRPNYSKTTQEVFRDAMRFCVEQEGGRLLFGYLSHRSHDDLYNGNSPSWVPKLWRPWDPQLDATNLKAYRPMRDSLAQERVIAGTGLDPSILLLKGIVLGRLDFLSPGLLPDVQDLNQALIDMVDMLLSHNVEVDDDQLIRVLTADRFTTLNYTPEDVRDGLRALVRRNKEQPIHHDLQFPADADATIISAAHFSTATLWACRHRKFAVTRKRSLGLVPKMCREGDVLALIWAGSRPVIMRECDDGSGEYIMLGECYIDGIMGEEDVERLRGLGSEVVFKVR